MLGNFLHSQCPAIQAGQVQPVCQSHHIRFRLVNGELLSIAATGTGNIRDYSGISKWRMCAIVIPLPGILLHATRDMFGDFRRQILVEHIDQTPVHFPGGILARQLRDGNDLDPVFLELALVTAKLDHIAEEPRQ